jgi:hypothetical protein
MNVVSPGRLFSISIVRIATAYRMAYMTRGGDGGVSKLQTQTSQNVQFSMERQQKAIYLRIQP